jgi:hypothetical protein
MSVIKGTERPKVPEVSRLSATGGRGGGLQLTKKNINEMKDALLVKVK